MSNEFINEQQLQAQINELKAQFSDTQDIYREACVLLFFRYGVTPTANKLYQYVRKGSMSAPAEALNKFWRELRDKSRVRIDRTDIPENIGLAAGEFVARLWVDAQKAAQDGFSELINNATAEILKFKLEAEISRKNLENIKYQLSETKVSLEIALNRLSETDYLLRSNTDTLASKEKALKSLKNEKNDYRKQIEVLKSSFSKDLAVINASLQKTEFRYESLERRSLIEIDQTRQLIKKLEKELQNSRKSNFSLEHAHKKELAKIQNTINDLRETNGLTKGKLVEVEKQLMNTRKKLVVTPRMNKTSGHIKSETLTNERLTK
ncbi:MAG: DNA-binding protein [Methylotenera sp.]|uniref:DNA-binding protein n=1 Tax=Methylotenera sp. TaxID=2051956 RepID=UPI00248A5AEF|nr:DNA-binding protein [Methylotenera sp.]MDI1309266.1 DNA-binding protein [Methylotenera sp.]